MAASKISVPYKLAGVGVAFDPHAIYEQNVVSQRLAETVPAIGSDCGDYAFDGSTRYDLTQDRAAARCPPSWRL